MFRTRQATFDMPNKNVLSSPCKHPPAERNRHVLNEKMASNYMYLNPRSTIVSFDPNHREQGLNTGNKTAATMAPHINGIRIRSAKTWPASCDLPFPYKYEICVTAAMAKKKPKARPIPSNAFNVETADKPSSPHAFDIHIDVIIP